jgi:hypothetical protein
MDAAPVVFQPAPIVFPQPTITRTTEVVLRYLLRRDDDALEHLASICQKACNGGPREVRLFLPDEWGEYAVEKIPTFDLLTGEKGHRSRREGTSDSTRRWITEWLLARLLQYEQLSPQEITSAAEQGAFRHLGRECRLALIDELRRRERRREQLGSARIAHDEPLNEDSNETLLSSIPANSSEGSSYWNDPSVLGEDIQAFVQERQAELGALCDGILSYAEALYVLGLGMTVREGDVTRLIAKRRNVTFRQASNYKSWFHREILRQQRRGNRAVQKLYKMLEPRDLIAKEPQSDMPKPNRDLMREAANLMADFRAWRYEPVAA